MPHRQTPHRAQVAQQPSDSLLELREAGQGVGRLQFARVVQPGLQHCEEGGEGRQIKAVSLVKSRLAVKP